MGLVDLSALIAPSPEGVPDFLRIDIAYHTHAAGAEQAQAILKVPPSVFRNGEGWATETITNLGTHSTTHIDALWHYNSTIQGQRAQTIDELPLEWFFNDGVVLDMVHKTDGDAITAGEMQQELEKIGYELKPLDIVLIRTGRDKFCNQPDYVFRGCGVTVEATRWLYEQGIRVMGIDSWGWDAPLDRQAREALDRGEAGIFWAAHQADLQYAQIERLVNLGQLPAHGFKVSCFPMKIKGGSAGPARVVAIV
ncbi:MAG: cyclase family protein [Deltaproteobacteria bacterium]|jgi:kynurenine formamidase|nr:cyclase family protein [Deltaproteobacteria bacterium]